jgi:hypothetical protein
MTVNVERVFQAAQQLSPAEQLELIQVISQALRRTVAKSEMETNRTAQEDGLRTLRQHPAFGAWRERQIDALEYEQALRAEWDVQQ